ncbi:MAG: 50S ribosomal protein L22 [Bacteroidales bacterium]|nr:50S ribosomal protein L22 [Bacteroidales bacterium]
MGSRKRISAEAATKARKDIAFAKLNKCPTSPRKMRLSAGLVRGLEVEKALHILKHSPMQASARLHKLLLSAVANWQAKNEGIRIEDANLFIKEIFVDSARMLKRIQTAPQGRAYRIRKRSNHVTIIVDNKNEIVENKA